MISLTEPVIRSLAVGERAYLLNGQVLNAGSVFGFVGNDDARLSSTPPTGFVGVAGSGRDGPSKGHSAPATSTTNAAPAFATRASKATT